MGVKGVFEIGVERVREEGLSPPYQLGYITIVLIITEPGDA